MIKLPLYESIASITHPCAGAALATRLAVKIRSRIRIVNCAPSAPSSVLCCVPDGYAPWPKAQTAESRTSST
eukprot:scaffold75351_cov31-Tisochrysis_lutea.AAC.2